MNYSIKQSWLCVNNVVSVVDIVTFSGSQQAAISGEAVTVTLADEIDVSRGDLLCAAASPAQTASQLLVDLVWMSETLKFLYILHENLKHYIAVSI